MQTKVGPSGAVEVLRLFFGPAQCDSFLLIFAGSLRDPARFFSWRRKFLLNGTEGGGGQLRAVKCGGGKAAESVGN
jgi:hypothetical protein